MSMITPILDEGSEFPLSGLIKSRCPPDLKLFAKADGKETATGREGETCWRDFEVEVIYYVASDEVC
jgi:hypothetical protein